MSERESRAERIRAAVRAIPRGQVETYGEIDPTAPRLVGKVLHDVGDDVPWHRVVRADGSLPIGEEQRARLTAEGVPMKGDRVDFTQLR
jgi:alkylated DNA nucleotide flippase Atl1